MQALTTTSTSSNCATNYHQNLQLVEEQSSDLVLNSNLDLSILTILEQIEAERDYYHTCGRW